MPAAGSIRRAAEITAGANVPVLSAFTTSPNLGADGAAVGSWTRTYNWVTTIIRFSIAGQDASRGDGTYEVSLPFPADLALVEASASLTDASILGSGMIRDATSGTLADVVPFLRSNTLLRMYAGGEGAVDHNFPTSSDDFPRRLWLHLGYPTSAPLDTLPT